MVPSTFSASFSTTSSSGWTPPGRGSDGRPGRRWFRTKHNPTPFGTHHALTHALLPCPGFHPEQRVLVEVALQRRGLGAPWPAFSDRFGSVVINLRYQRSEERRVGKKVRSARSTEDSI